MGWAQGVHGRPPPRASGVQEIFSAMRSIRPYGGLFPARAPSASRRVRRPMRIFPGGRQPISGEVSARTPGLPNPASRLITKDIVVKVFFCDGLDIDVATL